MSMFVLEIGTEELPARFLPGLEKELTERFSLALGEAGYENVTLSVHATPRRSVTTVEGLEAIQPVKEVLVRDRPPELPLTPPAIPRRRRRDLRGRSDWTYPCWVERKRKRASTFPASRKPVAYRPWTFWPLYVRP